MHIVNSLILCFVVWDAQIIRWVVWVGLVVLTVALLLLIRTRWGQSQPLSKCVVLSLLAHLLIFIYTTTVNIVTQTVGSPDGKGIQVALVDPAGGDQETPEPGTPDPWNSITPGESSAGIGATSNFVPRAGAPELPVTAEPVRQAPRVPAPAPIKLPEAAGSVDVGPPAFVGTSDPLPRPAAARPAEPIEVPQPDKTEEPDPVPPPAPEPTASGKDTKRGDSVPAGPASTPGMKGSQSPGGASPPIGAGSTGGAEIAGGQGGTGTGKPVPEVLQQRVGNHLQVAKGRGATQDSEARVTAALRWLAVNQSDSGRWEPRHFSGGAARAADREDRQGAGAQADSGITGLALLAFLAAGFTHQQGPHQTTVRRGLAYLISVQDADGCLGASNNRYERMYCHAMATCALSEAFAMTGDEWIGPAVRRAIRYTVLAQDRVAGGWRYHPGDPGDTSQLGWQVMALKSAELAGIAIPQTTRAGIQRFLNSVTAGRDGGLARYQPSRGNVTRSMTAEALVCRQFMGLNVSPDTAEEASGFILQELPGTAPTNVYYWYYATLSLYQVQGDAWQQWNDALQKNLFATQRTDGELAGSWDPDPVWGGCGGRVYSTALSALCLEVYYRFLPLYLEASGKRDRAK